MAAIRTNEGSVEATTGWWLEENADNRSQMVTQAAFQINQWQNWRRVAGQRFSQLFAGHADGDGAVSSSEMAGTPATATRNVCRQGVLTVLPKVSKHRPMPQFLTNGGDWKQYKRAKKMTEFVEGEFDQQDVFNTHWPTACRDALVYGDGITKCEPIEDWINVERILWWELLVDAYDARYGKPRCMYHVRTMDLGQALERYGKLRDKDPDDTEEAAQMRRASIRAAATSTPDPNWDCEGQFTSTMQRVRVVDGWHLCDNERAHKKIEVPKHDCNGRHTVCLLGNEEMLFDEVWDWDVFPILNLHGFDPLVGYRGVGLVRQLESWQTRITNQADKVDDAHRLSGNVVIMRSSASGTVTAQFTNDSPVCFVDFDGGVAPQATVMPVGDPQVYQRERDLPQDALSSQGISMQSAGGLKHPGINAAVAIEAIDDIEDEHWVPFGRAAEGWAVGMGKLMVRCASKIAKKYGEYSVQVKMRDDALIKLSWSQVSMNDFQVRCFPSSVLPQQPANRLQKLQTLFDGGIIDRQTFLQQLGAPDLNAEIDIVTAMRINLDEKLEAIIDAETEAELDKARARAMPSSYVDYAWMQARAQLLIMKNETKGCPPENLQALRDICDACEVIKDEQAAKLAPPPAPMGLPGMPPPGAGPAGPMQAPGMPPSPMSGPMPPMPTGNA